MIAIENVRLFNETKEALEQQTATADVLGVISHSMSDALPVFEKIIERCEHLFSAQAFALAIVDEQDRVSVPVLRMTAAARAQLGESEAEAIRARALAAFPRPLDGTLTEKAICSGGLIEIRDVLDTTEASQPAAQAAAQMKLGTSVVVAPLMWEGRGIGSLTMFRKDVEGLRERENVLFKSFADQAVIAIQNARLFNDTQEALRRQTATSEILRVISESPDNVQPVLEAVAERARLLCKADGGRVWLVDGEELRAMTGYGPGLRGRRAAVRAAADPRQFGGGAVRARAPIGAPGRRGAGSRQRVPRHPGTAGEVPRAGHPDHAAAARRRGAGRDLAAAARAARVRAQRDCAGADLRRSSRDRDPQRAAVQRDARGAGAADRPPPRS